MAPGELKKIRNKQRKAFKKAERERQRAAQAQEKREQHNKSRQQGDATEPDAPQQDELVPDKLARAEDPIEQAIRFLQPLQTLAADRIETHLMAFEIYSRKSNNILFVCTFRKFVCLKYIGYRYSTKRRTLMPHTHGRKLTSCTAH